MEIRTFQIDLDALQQPEQTTTDEALAQSIVALQGLLNVPVVERVGEDEYRLTSGHREYFAYMRAREIDPNLPDRLRVFIMPNNEAVQEQLSLLAPATEPETKIDSYDRFKTVAMDSYTRLNQEGDYEDLVPIHEIRQQIGELVTREQFDEWMLEMQANDLLQLQKGEVPGLTPEQARDSITTELSGLRYYASRI